MSFFLIFFTQYLYHNAYLNNRLFRRNNFTKLTLFDLFLNFCRLRQNLSRMMKTTGHYLI